MKLYVETSVPNFLFADDAPEKQRVTVALFEWLKICDDELFISKLVEDEIRPAPETKRRKMIAALADEQILERMLKLNLERAAEEAKAARVSKPKTSRQKRAD